MKILFTLFLFSVSVIISTAQTGNCGITSKLWKQEMLKNESRLAATNGNLRTASATGIKYIPLTIYLVRHTNGTYSANNSLDLLYKSLINTNRIYFPTGIQFYIDGNINLIDNDAYLKPVRGSADHSALLTHKNPNTANIWINDGWSGDASVGYGGTGGVELADLKFSTVAHEFGHFLTLAHTFETVNGIEHVARTGTSSNCTTAGDGICDTNADPYGLTVENGQLSGANPVNLNCSLISNTKDLTGTLYTPPYTNAMSYYYGNCGYEFTPGQFVQMLIGYAAFHTGYGQITGSGIASAPSNLSVTHYNGYDVIQWKNAVNNVATQIEISTDNGTTWKVMAAELSSVSTTNIHDVKKGTTYSFRARHLNSLAYSSTISYTAGFSVPVNPIQIEENNLNLTAINAVSIPAVSFQNISNGNQNYTIDSPAQPINLIRGGTYTVELNLTSSTGGTYTGIWIDENSDGDFDDINELKYQYASSTVIYTTDINVPISELCDTGFVRMRVRTFLGQSTLNPTTLIRNSEIEDYVLKIINGESTPYCSPVSTYTCGGSDYGIQSFSISAASFTNTSTACGITSDGYSDYTSKNINLSAGQTYSFTETNASGWGQSARYLNIYIDFNQNHVFDTNELVYTHAHTTTVPDPVTGTFSLPSGSVNGSTLLRIRAYYNPITDACASAAFGETEDYTVVITGGKEARVTNLTVTNITSGSMVINWKKSTGDNPTGYIINISTDGQHFSAYATADASATNYLVTGLQSDTRFYFQVIATGTTNSDPKIVYASTSAITTDITTEDLNTHTLKAFPNPIHNELHLVGSLAKKETAITIQNILGQSMAVSSIADEYGLLINTNELSKGVYFIIAVCGDQKQVIRFIKE